MPFKAVVAPKCPRCAKSVYSAEEKLACGKSWHEACFRCKECGDRIDNQTLTENNGEIYCATCHSKFFGPKGFGFGGVSLHTGVVESVSNNPASASAASSDSATPANNKAQRAVFQEQSSEKAAGETAKPSEGKKKKKPTFGGGEKCGRCGKTVYDAERCTGAGKGWHRECFCCKTCGDGLDATTQTDNAGEIYCKTCHGKQFGPKGFGIAGGIVHTK
eukprot:gb/GEZN01013677.1/.p1 GENE.gb/GEZN01013677.1/~~gb/GEZN01013677.1/.p1  ORF type:complete len:218 (-),score=27.85 gb/GEZN01013677.1/:329-982(-)